MCCSTNNGLLLPGTQTRFFFTQSDPVLRFKPTRVPIGSFKIKAKINDALVKESAGMSLYNLLGIPESGTLPEIKQAYKQLARKYHPDVSPPDRVEEYTKQFIRVQQAYETLSDPRRRALYDRDMSKGLHLAFSARKRYQNDVEMEDRGEWKNRWQSQLSELKRRSMNKEASGNMSWGARMRRQREELSKE
ncbi:chaperone protein dnaJ 20, chloroplastic-like [Mangifera indica]|uniref:chaperone protein dnaJ 20, chloroplastic-like n=1 Tax=Mangifera indica TaxID=29780 RepID=UPI001CFAA5EB|nr:chaperone protein dnaJ 20, chloroplastic-like [Mangifera indica]